MSQSLRQFRRIVVTSGIPVQLSLIVRKVPSAVVIADPSNTGTIFLGDSNVDAATRLGIPIIANDSVTLDPTEFLGTTEEIELFKIFVDSTANGDAVIVSFYENEDD